MNYDAITKKAEERIARLMERAATKPPEEAMLIRQWAYGVFLFWEDLTLTIGSRKEGDAARIEAMTRHD